MVYFLVAVGVVVFALILVLLFKNRSSSVISQNDTWLASEFKRCNVIVFGKKGTGKDLIFAHVIALRNDFHYANMPYTALTEVIDIKDISLGSNTFKDCVDGSIEPVPPQFKDGTDIYLSDGGIYLPSHEDSRLPKYYPSFGMFYALSRQLYDLNIHVNVQNLSRLWKKLREQADCYIRCLKAVDKGDYILVHTICYDTYAAAESMQVPSVLPARYGVVKARTFKIPKDELHYDTRYFRRIFIENQNQKGVVSCLDEVFAGSARLLSNIGRF